MSLRLRRWKLMQCVLAWEGGGRGELQRAVGGLAWTRQRELMGPAAVDDEAKSCLPAASQAPQTAKQCTYVATPVTTAGSGWPKLGGKLWRNRQGFFFGRQRRDLQVTIDLLQPNHNHFSLSSLAYSSAYLPTHFAYPAYCFPQRLPKS